MRIIGSMMFVALLLGAGCIQHRGPKPSRIDLDPTGPGIAIQYKMRDVPIEHQITLSFFNDTSLGICLTPENWPNSKGKIHQASDTVALVVGTERFPIKYFNAGYCPGGCALLVAPGETVEASIPYDDFELPEALYNSDKRLDFVPLGFPCRKGE